MKKALIFGSNGQDGVYLMQLLNQLKIDTIGVSRKNAKVVGDVSDFGLVESLVLQIKPDYIFHLAAVSSTNHRFLFENHAAIATGTINILEAVLLHKPDCRVFLSGSALQFENSGIPIKETDAFDPNSAYSLARIHSANAGRYYRNKYGIKVYLGYFFNHDSPLRNDIHINQKIVNAVRDIAQGNSKVFKLGNAEVKKEFNFAGDIVKAVWCLVNQDQVFEATLGSGIAHPISEWLDYCFKSYGLEWTQHVKFESIFKADYDILVSDASTIKSLGWQPRLDIYELADLMLSNTKQQTN